MPNRSKAQESLHQHMDRRRAEFGLRWTDVADAAGVSKETIRAMRNDADYDFNTVRSTTKTGIERVLLWDRGSFDAILRGGKPTPVEPPDQFVNELPNGWGALREQAGALLRRIPDERLPDALGCLAPLVES